MRPATAEDVDRHNAVIDAKGNATADGPHVEYRVIENHVVKFEQGKAPYIYSMSYDVEQH
jgi:hypothetical protein